MMPRVTKAAESWLSVLPEVEAVARRAGDRLMALRALPGELHLEFKGRRDLVTRADREAERIVVGWLRERFPDHGVFAEEGVLTPAGRPDREAEWVWYVDPLDGTTNFVHGIPCFSVAIGLVRSGVPWLAVVHVPPLEETYTAVRGHGAFRNGKPITVSRTTDLRDALLATGFSYHRNEPGVEDNSARLARALPACRDLRRIGSAQLDLCWTAAGVFDGFWELHLQPFDVAAGALVVTEAEGRVTDLCGGGDWLHGGQILASNGRLHEDLLATVGGPPQRGET